MDKPNDLKPLSVFLRHAAIYKWRFGTAFVLMPLTAWLTVQGPALIQKAIDNGIKLADVNYVIESSIFYIAVLATAALVDCIQNILLQSAGIRSLKHLRDTVVHHICHLGKKDYDAKPLGVHLSRATSDVENIGETFLQGIHTVAIVSNISTPNRLRSGNRIHGTISSDNRIITS